MQTELFVVFSDTHPNSTVGLCSPVVKLDEGQEVSASPAQMWLWEHWLEQWTEIAALKKKHRAKVIACCVGDGSDDNVHAKGGLISSLQSTIVSISASVLEPVMNVCDALIMLRGTPAHTGEGASLEEIVAQRVGAVRDTETGNYTWREWLGIIGGVTIQAVHHPPSRTWLPQTRGNAARNSAFILTFEAQERVETPPQLAFYGHTHTFQDSGTNYATRVFFLDSWQLRTDYDFRRGAGGRIRPVGSIVCICKDGQYQQTRLKYLPKRREPWTLE